MHTWDVAAPLVLIEEAGGRVTDVTGARRIDAPSFVGSNGHLHDELLRRLATPPDERRWASLTPDLTAGAASRPPARSISWPATRPVRGRLPTRPDRAA